MRIILSIVILLGLASPALALSCMPYSVEQAYKDAAGSKDAYILVNGTLSFNPADLPRTNWDDQANTPPDTMFKASLTGFSLTREGFTARFVQNVQVNVQCYGPWCAGLTSEAQYLTFLKRTSSGYLLETNPCGGFAFQNPDETVLKKMQRCLQGKRCDPADRIR